MFVDAFWLVGVWFGLVWFSFVISVHETIDNFPRTSCVTLKTSTPAIDVKKSLYFSQHMAQTTIHFMKALESITILNCKVHPVPPKETRKFKHETDKQAPIKRNSTQNDPKQKTLRSLRFPSFGFHEKEIHEGK